MINPDIKMVLFEKEHMHQIKLRPHDQWIKESPFFEQWIEDRFNGAAYTGMRISDGAVIGCGGLKVVGEGLAEIWAAFCDEIENYKKEAYEYPIMYFPALIKKMGLKKIIAGVRMDDPQAVKYIESLGFKKADIQENGKYIYSLEIGR
jgi:hypothetical protein